MKEDRTAYLATPVGMLILKEDEFGITECSFIEEKREPETNYSLYRFIPDAIRELNEYFDGTRKNFTVPVSLHGTAFQLACWCELQKIPYGQTRSYQQIAERVGNIKACRAVGMANHRNPVAIIVPCHRVIGKNNSLTGYAGGIKRKELLLNLEKNGEKQNDGKIETNSVF